MALIPKIDFILNQNGLTLQDTTGRYQLDDNANGWGTPNIDYSDIVSAVVSIENTTTGELSEYTLDYSLLVTTPEVITFGPYENTFSDGIIEATLTLIDGSENEYVGTACKFYMLNIQCCVDKLNLGIIGNEDDMYYCNKVNKINAYYDALCTSAKCLDKEKIIYWLNKLNKICNPCA